MKHLILLLLPVFFLVSCFKDKDAPGVTITSPTAGQVIDSGTAIIMKAEITDKSLHSLKVELKLAGTGTTLYSIEPGVHDVTAYSFNETWNASGFSGTMDIMMEVTAIDVENNKTVKSVLFKAMH